MGGHCGEIAVRDLVGENISPLSVGVCVVGEPVWGVLVGVTVGGLVGPAVRVVGGVVGGLVSVALNVGDGVVDITTTFSSIITSDTLALP